MTARAWLRHPAHHWDAFLDRALTDPRTRYRIATAAITPLLLGHVLWLIAADHIHQWRNR